MMAPEIIHQYSLKDLLELLLREHDIHEGLYDIATEFQIAAGAVGPSQDQLLPGAIIGLSRVGIMKVDKLGPNTVDAAIVNPKKTLPKPRTNNKKD